MTLRSEGLAEVGDHGGSLRRAEALFPHAPKPFVDLSTGINPHPYPLFDLPATAFTRLPEPRRLAALAAAAAAAYGAPSAASVVPAPGTQILLPLVAALIPPDRASVLGPTYAEHRRAAALAGHEVEETADFDRLVDADLAILVNPNNPDGRILPRARLLDLAAAIRGKGGLLVVDEAFMDVGPREESLAGDVGAGGMVVLRSFGKFFGLAGLRLGFALAEAETARRIAAKLGPWAVSGPALEFGLRALPDRAWQDAMRQRLAREAAALDRLFLRYGLETTGGTSLFRFFQFSDAASLFCSLGESGIIARRFAERPNDLRVGLPAGAEEFARIEAALDTWSTARGKSPKAVRE